MADTGSRPYVSCIKSFGRPILPPLMTDEKRLLMRHFKALACEREAAREKKKEAAPPSAFVQADQESLKDGVEIRATESSPLPELHTSPPSSTPCQPPRHTGLPLRTVSSSTAETGSSTTLVPSSPEEDSEEGDDTSTVADSVDGRLIEEEEPSVQESKEPYSEGDSLSTVRTTPAMTRATTPVTGDRFCTKVSVPSLCRSRSFVVERPSLALLLRKGLGRDGRDSIMDGVNIKIVQPLKSPNKTPLEQSPDSRCQTSFTGAPEQPALLAKLGVSETFVQEGGSGDVASIADTTECAFDGSDKRPNRDVRLQHESGPKFLRDEGQPVAAPSTRLGIFKGLVAESGRSCVLESPERRVGSLQGEMKDSNVPVTPRGFSETVKNAFEMPAEDLKVPHPGESIVVKTGSPNVSFNLRFDGREKDSAAVADETLNDVSNFERDEDETVVEDIFADALDDGDVLLNGSAMRVDAANGEAPPKFGETFVSPWDHRGARFTPASTSSVRHSIGSSTGSMQSSGGESDVLALPLDASWDAEEEERYEDASEVCGSPASDDGGRGDIPEDPERSFNASLASPRHDRRKSGEWTLSADDMFAANDLRMEEFCRSLMREYSLNCWGPSSAPPGSAGEHDSLNAGTASLEMSRGHPTSPASCRASVGYDSSSNSLPADLSSVASRLEQSIRPEDASVASSIHLDLLSETRQSLHPRWRRCFDRLTAMARGHLTRRLMKTQRVQSIIQTIRDTLECALHLHGEPHIRSGLVTPQDVELHQRLITQLTSACHELHDVFFNIPVAERMHLIGQLRSQRTRLTMGGASRQEAGGRRISSATQKVLERRLSKLTGRGQVSRVKVDRPTAIVRSQTFVAMAAPADTCHAAGGASSGTTRKICRLPMYKV